MHQEQKLNDKKYANRANRTEQHFRVFVSALAWKSWMTHVTRVYEDTSETTANPKRKRIIIQDNCVERTCTPERVQALFNGKKDESDRKLPAGPSTITEARRFTFVTWFVDSAPEPLHLAHAN